MADIGQTAPGAAPVNQLSPRQRMEGLLQALPTAGSLLADEGDAAVLASLLLRACGLRITFRIHR